MRVYNDLTPVQPRDEKANIPKVHVPLQQMS